MRLGFSSRNAFEIGFGDTTARGCVLQETEAGRQKANIYRTNIYMACSREYYTSVQESRRVSISPLFSKVLAYTEVLTYNVFFTFSSDYFS